MFKYICYITKNYKNFQKWILDIFKIYCKLLICLIDLIKKVHLIHTSY